SECETQGGAAPDLALRSAWPALLALFESPVLPSPRSCLRLCRCPHPRERRPQPQLASVLLPVPVPALVLRCAPGPPSPVPAQEASPAPHGDRASPADAKADPEADPISRALRRSGTAPAPSIPGKLPFVSRQDAAGTPP